MSEEKPKERLTSAEIKKQIQEASKAEKAKTEIKESGMPMTEMLVNEINASASSTPEEKPTAESKPEPAKAAEEKTTPGVDLNEWAKKKGVNWTTDTAVYAALYKSDQEWHKKHEEDLAKERTNTFGGSLPPAYNPPLYPQFQPQNGYSPAYIPQNRTIIENIARQYNMTTEDVERLAAFNKDFFEVAIKAERDRLQGELDSMRVENQKNSVFRELSSDPVFRRPEVAIEYHQVLDEMRASDPQSFEKDPNAYRRAYDRVLANIGRRNLEGKPLQEGIPPKANPLTPPTTPPRPLGMGSGGGALENENGIDPNQFAKLPLEEKRAYLEARGLRSA